MSNGESGASAESGEDSRRSVPAGVTPFPTQRARWRPDVSFDRQELREIMNVYGRGVAEGAWRDYALDFTPDKAVLSIYRRASEVPLYRVEKDPALARKQGAFAVVNATGFVLKRGHELARVLRVLEPKPKLSVV